MVLYFSTTGNSKYVAGVLAKELSDNCMDLFDRMKNDDHTALHSDKPWVIVCPIYAYKIPPILENWLLQTLLEGSRQMYFVITCGAGICGAGYYDRKIAVATDKEYMGTAKIVMPENYLPMYKAPEREEALKIIEKAEPSIHAAAKTIKKGERLEGRSDGRIAALGSAVVNRFFYGLVIKDTKFRVTEACIGCGKCARECVKNNIEMVDGKPAWTGHCIHCMACVCGCPKKAIEYGNKTKNKVRYKCPK